jgi:hypothetical protein
MRIVMKAIIARVELDVNYRCPNCFLHFRLSNKKVPQNKPMNLDCPECMQKLTIPPLFKTNKKQKILKKNDPVIKSAKMALTAMGFKNNEATTLVGNNYHEGISVADLIKGALKDVESPTTGQA